QNFRQEAALRMPGRPHRPLLAGVDVDVLVRALAVRELVNVRQRESGRRARAARAPALAVERGELAVGAGAGANVRGRRRTIAGIEMLFLAVEHQLHRRVGLPGQFRADETLRVRSELAAEPAAHVLRDDAYVRFGNHQALRESLPR